MASNWKKEMEERTKKIHQRQQDAKDVAKGLNEANKTKKQRASQQAARTKVRANAGTKKTVTPSKDSLTPIQDVNPNKGKRTITKDSRVTGKDKAKEKERLVAIKNRVPKKEDLKPIKSLHPKKEELQHIKYRNKK